MVFQIHSHCEAFLKVYDHLHYEFCRVTFDTYRNDLIKKKKLRQQYGSQHFLVLPTIDYEELLDQFLAQLPLPYQRRFEQFNLPQSQFDKFHAFHCFCEETEYHDAWERFTQTKLCDFAAKWCEDQGIPYTMEA